MKICCVIVTYNRKDLLIECLECVKNQTFKPHTVLIVDNASTDGTIELVKSQGYYNTVIDGVIFNYLLLPNNQGGAGGFYNGIKTAHQSTECFDGFWVMDDDGKPHLDCLKNLLPYLGKYHFISPMVVSIEDNKQMAFFEESVKHFESKCVEGVYKGDANPFNGVLFSKYLIDNIGYPKKEMFIWGDEQNYMLRTIKLGFDLVIISNAIHFHPKNRQQKEHVIFNREIIVTDVNWKLFCLIRNTVYNCCLNKRGKLRKVRCMIGILFNYFICFVVKKKQIHKLSLICEASYKGLIGEFSGLDKYFNA